MVIKFAKVVYDNITAESVSVDISADIKLCQSDSRQLELAMCFSF